MIDEEKRLKDIIARGEDADSWLNHPTFKHVIALRQTELIKAFKSTKSGQSEERDEIWRKTQALDTVVADFERLIRNARNARKALEKTNGTT